MNARETVKDIIVKKFCTPCPFPNLDGDYCIKCQKQLEDAYQEGMRTVVEWVEQHEEKSYLLKIPYYSFGKDKWQAQLKEWGLG